MTTLRAKLFLFLSLLVFVPSVSLYICYGEVLKLYANSVQLQEVQSVSGFIQRNNIWTDGELGAAQALRFRLTFPDLQNLFSLWIQSRSEDSVHLMQFRGDALEQFVKSKTEILQLGNESIVHRISSLFAGLSLFIIGSALTGYYFAKQRVLLRLGSLERDIGQFRVMDHQTRLPPKMPTDEITDVWIALRAMIDTLYIDLHEYLNIEVAKTTTSFTGAGTTMKGVQEFLIERRSRHRDRRANDRRGEVESARTEEAPMRVV
jgi:hypothetical protein